MASNTATGEESQATCELYDEEGGEHRWRLRHRNGNSIAGDGMEYSDRSGASDGLESVKRNALNAGFEEPAK